MAFPSSHPTNIQTGAPVTSQESPTTNPGAIYCCPMSVGRSIIDPQGARDFNLTMNAFLLLLNQPSVRVLSGFTLQDTRRHVHSIVQVTKRVHKPGNYPESSTRFFGQVMLLQREPLMQFIELSMPPPRIQHAGFTRIAEHRLPLSCSTLGHALTSYTIAIWGKQNGGNVAFLLPGDDGSIHQRAHGLCQPASISYLPLALEGRESWRRRLDERPVGSVIEPLPAYEDPPPYENHAFELEG